MASVLLLLLILIAFACMSRGWLRQEVAMPLVALSAMVLAGADAERALQQGFAEFAHIALLFTAVAVPAHQLLRAGAFRWVSMWLGEYLGFGILHLGLAPALLVPGVCLVLTYLMAALFHNTTSILVCSSIIVVICQSYQLRPLPILCAALVASNLGGFSTKWGDTPNIITAMLWGLRHQDFFSEIFLINFALVGILAAVVSAGLWRGRPESPLLNAFDTPYAVVVFRRARKTTPIDWRLLCIGSLGLGIAVVGPMISPNAELRLSALAIVLCCLADRVGHRKDTLLALGIETYVTLCSISVLAHVLTHADIGIGGHIKTWLEGTGMGIWAIATASYFGTLLTEAASWATAVAPIIHASAPTHVAAWALGAGICAGSSSLVTAASAGIILTNETKDNKPDAQVTFGTYLPFGLRFSLFMLVYYLIVLSLLW